MYEVTCSRCQKKIDSNLTQKCGHCKLEPLCETFIPMDVHVCGEKEKSKMNLVKQLIAAIDEFQAVRIAPPPQEQDAFAALIAIRDAVSSAYHGHA